MDNGALGHVAANLHRQFVPPSSMGPEEGAGGAFAGASPVFYAKTDSANWLYDSGGVIWTAASDAGWARFCKAVPCNSQGTYLDGYSASGPFVYIEFPFPVAGSGMPGVRLMAFSTVIRYVLSDGRQVYGAYTMDGFCLDAPLGNHVPWCPDGAIGERLLWWNASMVVVFEDRVNVAYPTGWHWCDGTAGVGKNSITVPDFRDRVLKVGNSGTTGGYAQHQLYDHDHDFAVLSNVAGTTIPTSWTHVDSELDSNWPPFRTAGLAMWIGVVGF